MPDATALSATTHLLGFDAWHLELLSRAFSALVTALPGIGAIVIVYYIILSLAMTFLADRHPSALVSWAVKLTLNIVILTILLGSTFTFKSRLLGSVSKGFVVNSLNDGITFRAAGKNSHPIKVSAFGQMPFDAFAYLDSDIEFAAIGANYAAGSIALKPEEMTLFVVRQGGADRTEKALASLSTAVSEKGAAKSLIFFSNLFVSVSYAVSHLAGLSSVKDKFLLEKIKEKFSAKEINPFAQFSFRALKGDRHGPVYAAVGDVSTSKEVVAATYQIFPGAVYGFSEYALRRAADPTISYASKVLDMEEIKYAAEHGKFQKDVSTKVPSKFKSGQAHYQLEDTKVAPQLYIRTHLPLFLEQCRADLSIRPDEGKAHYSEDPVALLDPCKIKVKEPIVVSSATGSDLFFDDLLKGVFDFFGFGATPTNLLSSLSDLVASDFGFSAQSTSCDSPSNLNEAYQAYENALKKDDPEVRSNYHCLVLGKNIVGAMLDMAQQAKDNDSKYDAYRFGGAPNLFGFFLEESEVFAEKIPLSSNKFVFAQLDANYADASSVLRSIIRPFKGIVPYDQLGVKQPGVFSNTAEKVAIGTAGAIGASQAIAAAAATERGSRFLGAVKRVASSAVGAVKKKAIGVSAKIASALRFFGGPLRILLLLIGLFPVSAMLLSYTLAYHTAILGTIVGLAGTPLWLLLSFGKAMMSMGGGDEHRHDLSLLPFGRYLFVPLAIGLELGLLGIAASMTMSFIGGMFSTGLKVLWGALNAYFASAAFGYTLQDPLATIASAFKPFGIAIGVAALPALFHGFIFGQEYRPQARVGFETPISAFMGQTASVPGVVRAYSEIRGGRGGDFSGSTRGARPSTTTQAEHTSSTTLESKAERVASQSSGGLHRASGA